MAKSNLRLVAPTTVNRTVMPRRRPNRELRSREHLTEAEVEKHVNGQPNDRLVEDTLNASRSTPSASACIKLCRTPLLLGSKRINSSMFFKSEGLPEAWPLLIRSSSANRLVRCPVITLSWRFPELA